MNARSGDRLQDAARAQPTHRVHLVASDPKHAPFYQAIAATERLLGNELHVWWLNQNKHRRFWNKGIRALFPHIIRCPEPIQRIYLEEYLGPGDLLLTCLLCLCFKRIKVSVCLHNLNKWLYLEYWPSPKRILTYIASSLLLRRAQEVIVVSEALKSYGEQICNFKKNFRVISFTPAAAEKAIDIGESSKLFTIPGNVEEKRRDYPTVLAACRRLAAEGKDFKLVFLCRLKPASLSEPLRQMMMQFSADFPGRLVTFEQFIEDDLYQAYIAGSTCLIANLVPYFRGDYGTTEFYGRSKETGIRAWADSHDKPCLTPHEMPAGAIARNYLRYGNATELYELLAKLA